MTDAPASGAGCNTLGEVGEVHYSFADIMGITAATAATIAAIAATYVAISLRWLRRRSAAADASLAKPR